MSAARTRPRFNPATDRWTCRELIEGESITGRVVRMPTPGAFNGSRVFLLLDDGQVVGIHATAGKGRTVLERELVRRVTVGDRVTIRYCGFRSTADGEREYRDYRLASRVTSAGISCPSASKSRGRPLGPTAVAIREAVLDLTSQYERMTVRQVFYRLEVLGVVEKTEGGYRQVQAQVLKMRREGLLPWAFVTDGTRWMRKPRSWDRVEDAMADMARTYRRDLWASQNVRIEIWLEKDALADTVTDVTSKWDVPLMVSRGQSSATFLWNAAQAARQAWDEAYVETVVYALYDRDGGGRRAARGIEQGLAEHAPGVPIRFELLAVTERQIDEWDLPTRPAKQSDPEARKFSGPAVELDAIPPDKLISLVETSIRGHIDVRQWEIEQAVEREERGVLLELARAA